MRTAIYGILQDFVTLSRNTELLSDSALIGYEIDEAFDASSLFLKKNCTQSDLVLSYEVEWCGNGTTFHDLLRDFFLFYAFFSECSQFIDQEIGQESVIFRIVSGNIKDCPHVHIVQFRVVGEKVARLVID